MKKSGQNAIIKKGDTMKLEIEYEYLMYGEEYKFCRKRELALGRNLLDYPFSAVLACVRDAIRADHGEDSQKVYDIYVKYRRIDQWEGRQIYEQYCKPLFEKAYKAPSWEELDDHQRAAWQTLAEVRPEVRGISMFNTSYNPPI